MLKTLYAKLALALVVLLASVALVYTLLSIFSTQRYLQSVDQRLNRSLARDLVADRNLVAEGRINEAELRNTFDEYMTINPSIEIYLLDTDGKILSFSADPGKVKRKHVSLEPIRAFLDERTRLPLLGDDPRSHDRRKAFSVTPVPTASDPEGYLYVVLRGERFDTIDAVIGEQNLLRLSGWALVASLIFGLMAGLIIFRLLTRRLQRLTRLIDDFRRSGFRRAERYDAHTHGAGDEIDRLGHSFDAMASRIATQIEELERNDNQRREMVAHVSHDLRTPLAALHGYLETLELKDDRLSPEERKEYLQVALSHSTRLTELVSDLFELAKLDAGAALRREPFAAPELVQDITQKFALRAQEKDTELTAELAGHVPLVDGDIALVERVLENLIDNAINHTPAGGRIHIPVRSLGDHVLIEVQDTGVGIPSEDLPRVFDRFYRSGNPHRDSTHAGLGLAIAKRILELHGSRLEVKSAQAQGTTFAFALPVHRAPIMGP